jgi:hypothetical protein
VFLRRWHGLLDFLDQQGHSVDGRPEQECGLNHTDDNMMVLDSVHTFRVAGQLGVTSLAFWVVARPGMPGMSRKTDRERVR